MIIRSVQASERPELLTLIRAKAEFDGCPESLRATAEALHEALFGPRPLAHALVAEVEGQLVGTATYCAIFSSFIVKPGLWLGDLFCARPVPEHGHRRGADEKALRQRPTSGLRQSALACLRLQRTRQELLPPNRRLHLGQGATGPSGRAADPRSCSKRALTNNVRP